MHPNQSPSSQKPTPTKPSSPTGSIPRSCHRPQKLAHPACCCTPAPQMPSHSPGTTTSLPPRLHLVSQTARSLSLRVCLIRSSLLARFRCLVTLLTMLSICLLLFMLLRREGVMGLFPGWRWIWSGRDCLYSRRLGRGLVVGRYCFSGYYMYC